MLGSSSHSATVSGAKANLKSGSSTISADTMQLAARLGMSDALQRLRALRLQASSDLQGKVELLACKQELTEQVIIAEQELRTVVARIDSELADASEIHAHLSERRDRAVRFNTYANLVSGGITGIVGGACQTASLNHFSYDLIDTTEGAIQTCLASWAFRQQHGEKRIESGLPNLLNHLMARNSDAQNDYPSSVWSYLTLPARGSKDPKGTIVSTLVDRWFRLHLCLKHGGHREHQKTRIPKIANATDARLTIDILEDRMAMLNDLQACVRQMDYLVLELMQFIHGTKSLPD